MINSNFYKLFAFTVLISLACAVLWIFFIRQFSHCLIWFSLILSVSIWVVVALASFAVGSMAAAVVALLFAGHFFWFFYFAFVFLVYYDFFFLRKIATFFFFLCFLELRFLFVFVYFFDTFFLGLQALWIYCVRHRIEFAAAVLQIAVSATNKMSTTYIVSFIGVVVQS